MANDKQALFEREKKTLDIFLEHHAISKTQYLKSLLDLIEKMGIKDYTDLDQDGKGGTK